MQKIKLNDIFLCQNNDNKLIFGRSWHSKQGKISLMLGTLLLGSGGLAYLLKETIKKNHTLRNHCILKQISIVRNFIEENRYKSFKASEYFLNISIPLSLISLLPLLKKRSSEIQDGELLLTLINRDINLDDINKTNEKIDSLTNKITLNELSVFDSQVRNWMYQPLQIINIVLRKILDKNYKLVLALFSLGCLSYFLKKFMLLSSNKNFLLTKIYYSLFLASCILLYLSLFKKDFNIFNEYNNFFNSVKTISKEDYEKLYEIIYSIKNTIDKYTLNNEDIKHLYSDLDYDNIISNIDTSKNAKKNKEYIKELFYKIYLQCLNNIEKKEYKNFLINKEIGLSCLLALLVTYSFFKITKNIEKYGVGCKTFWIHNFYNLCKKKNLKNIAIELIFLIFNKVNWIYFISKIGTYFLLPVFMLYKTNKVFSLKNKTENDLLRARFFIGKSNIYDNYLDNLITEIRVNKEEYKKIINIDDLLNKVLLKK